MIEFSRVIVVNFLLLSSILSCTPSAPYEIKSPCVAVEAEDEYDHAIRPCVRRPVNFGRAIV